MEAKDTVIKEILATHGYTIEEAEGILNNAGRAIYQAGMRKVVEWIDNLIIGIEGCKFEERLDGDKGCIVLDMNENQWKAFKKERGL